jgi:hypothetical protein
MQAGARIIVFPKEIMSTQADPTATPPHTWWQRHGTTVQWLAIGATFLASLVNPIATACFRHSDQTSKTDDEHTKSIVSEAVKETVVPRLNAIDDKLSRIDTRVATLEGWKEGISGQVGVLEQGQQKQRQTQEALLEDTERLRDLAPYQTLNHVLNAIFTNVKKAETTSRVLPPSAREDYRAMLVALGSQVKGNDASAIYWKTVAALINYQSFVDQSENKAPNPDKVANLCTTSNEGYVHSHDNTFANAVIEDCKVDLDTQSFKNVIFKDSVVRYHGGPTTLEGVQFVNCHFVIDFAPKRKIPSTPALLQAILTAPSQTKVAVSASPSGM